MKFADLYHEAILWTCYLENFSSSERFLNLYGLDKKDILLFDCLGKFFPFDEFFVRGECSGDPRGIENLHLSKKPLILPWIYRPKRSADTLCRKHILCPPSELFALLDDKVVTKQLFQGLGIPTPDWGFIHKRRVMVEKPIRNSAGGLGIRLTNDNARQGFFLEEYLEEYHSIALQFFVYEEAEFICANEMLYHGYGERKFTFHSQINVMEGELSTILIGDCVKVILYLRDKGYRGLVNIDALVGNEDHYLLEINPRGSAFLPAFFAASAHGWTRFITHMKEETAEKGEILLISFGNLKKVVRKLQ